MQQAQIDTSTVLGGPSIYRVDVIAGVAGAALQWMFAKKAG